MKLGLIFLLLFFSYTNLSGQLVINEASNANGNTIIMTDGSSPDWIEIYNSSAQSIQLGNYFLSDKKSKPFKWKFPELVLGANQFAPILATGFDRKNSTNHYETAIYPNYSWKYLIPDANTPADWAQVNTSIQAWTDAPLGIGYGDNDDATTISQQVASIYVRYLFNISDTSILTEAILDVDFDDGFVAYINGVEVARSGLTGFPPTWNENASDHEALIYQGGNPGRFMIDNTLLKSCLREGNNVLAIEVHNSTITSSDLTLIPFLTFGIKQSGNYFGGTTHNWFNLQVNSSPECNFTIKPEGETLYLSDSAGNIIDSVSIPDLDNDMSFGRKTDGSTNFVFFTTPTPGTSNNSAASYTNFEMEPTIGVKGGFYNAPIKVAIINNSTDNGIIRYTLDGQNPVGNSPIYMDSVTLNANTVLKARCFSLDPNILPSPTATQTYFFMEDFTLPVVSITTDNVNLYGAEGIFDNYWTDWKKPCFIEYYDKDGNKQFDSKASVKCDGGAGGSRGNPQHSITVEPSNSTYGEGKPVLFPLIPEKPFIKEYHAFYLRNGSNMWNAYPQKDANFMRIMRESNANSQAYSPVIVFLNGEYFGIYELREKANAEYFEANYGNDPDSLDLLSISYFYAPSVIRTIEGSDTGFYNMKNFVTGYDPNLPDYFNKCHQKLDLINFADYLAGENWFANYDWIYNNMKIFRTRTKGNRWRFNLQDMELGLGSWTDYNSDLFDYLETQNLPNPFNEMYGTLIQNEAFKNYYLNRYADLMNTIFQPDHYQPLTMDMYNELLPEMPRHFERWTGDIFSGMATYQWNLSVLLDQFANRNSVIRDQIVSHFGLEKQVNVTLDVNPHGAGYIKISTIVPETLPWTGVYFDGVPIEITAVANPGFEFVDWSSNTEIPLNELNKTSLLLNIDTDNLFRANFAGDSSGLTLTVSEINYNSDPTINGGNWIELHNYGTKALTLDGWKLKSKKQYESYEIPLHTNIEAKGFLVICEDTALFKKIYPGVANFIGSTEFGWDNSFDTITLRHPYAAYYLTVPYSDSLPYPECADGWGRTLELKNSLANLSSPSSWFCGCVKGSPGKKFEPCPENIRITEINHYSVLSPNNAGDWIEIQNTGEESINLQNYSFRDSKDDHLFTFPDYLLLPGQYVVLLHDQQAFSAQHANVTNTIGTFDFGLSSEKEVVRIYDENELITSILYRSSGGWPSKPAESNYTLERSLSDSYSDPNNPTSWFVGCFQGSPGREFSTCLYLDKNSLMGIYPNPGNEYLWIVFNNELAAYLPMQLQIYDVSGRIIQEKIINSSDKLVGEKLDLTNYENGMYYVRVTYGNEKIQKPFVKY